MKNLQMLCAVLGILVVVFLLIKKKDTKTVLIGAGLVLCIIGLSPMKMLTAFSESMTKANLIKSICASMGFAYVMKYTKCDEHLVHLLTKPIKGLGFFLIPVTYMITSILNIAIPSASGCAAAVGATLIPLLLASGVKPAMAGACVMLGTFGGVLSPGSAHNIFIANLAKIEVSEVIKVQFPNALISFLIVIVSISVLTFVFKDYDKNQNYLTNSNANLQNQDNIKVNILYALMPILPILILIIGATPLAKYSFLSWCKMGVAEAMILGAIVSIIVTFTNPQDICKEFFKGAGNAYADIMGIIIAASVFVAGLKACGAVDFVIEWLKHDQSYAKYGGTFIPFIMGLVTGSGDAASMAFNTAITPHAAELGFNETKLGMAVAICGALGRSASPIAGAAIICAGLSGASPIEIAKRTAICSFICLITIAFFLL